MVRRERGVGPLRPMAKVNQAARHESGLSNPDVVDLLGTPSNREIAIDDEDTVQVLVLDGSEPVG